jgi:hypothetical protein
MGILTGARGERKRLEHRASRYHRKVATRDRAEDATAGPRARELSDRHGITTDGERRVVTGDRAETAPRSRGIQARDAGRECGRWREDLGDV